MTTVTFESTFPYRLSGKIAAEFEVRARCHVAPGSPEVRYLRNGDPGYPAEDPELEDIEDIEVDVGGFDAKRGKWVSEWVAPDPHLASLIEAWLVSECAENIIAQAAEEPDDDRPDRREDAA